MADTGRMSAGASKAAATVAVVLTAVMTVVGEAAARGSAEEYISELLSLRAGEDSTIASDADGLTTDYLGGEAVTAPKTGDTTMVDGVAHTWVKVEEASGEWSVGAEHDYAVAYWTFSVLSFQERDVKLRYRHAGGLRIWAYGDLVVDEADGGLGMERESGAIHLQEGITRFLFKVHREGAEAFFAARLVSLEGEAVSYIANFDRGGVPAGGIITLVSPPAHAVSATIDTAFSVGQTLAVTWIIDPARLDAGVSVEVSVDDGRGWISLVSDPIENDDPRYGGTDTATFAWTIPESLVVPEQGAVSPVSETVRVRVWSQYATGTPSDVSGRFAIVPGSSATARHSAGTVQARRGTGRMLTVPLGQTRVPDGHAVVDVSGRRLDPARHAGRRQRRTPGAAGVFITKPRQDGAPDAR